MPRLSPSSSHSDDFYDHQPLDTLIHHQGVKPVDGGIFEEIQMLVNDLWPSAEEQTSFSAFLKEIRIPVKTSPV
jgi:hypothetical protein